ncbi:MAG: hypothetical protein HOH66_02360 [Rhodospirillaceae bacterium]|nr:hypothetical protein [Rhodospirillaceae bacterium]MBT6116690.1 hypothetical protein [Rhodospirillaceae bacterium]
MPRRRLLALLGIGLPAALLTRGARAQDALPDCTQTGTYGSWTVVGTRQWGSVAREVASGGETFKVYFDFDDGSFSLTFAKAYGADIRRGGESLGTYIYDYDIDFDDWFESFGGEEVRVVNALSDGSDLTVDATYEDDSTESYTIDSFGFADALDLMERQRANAIALEDAGKCEYDEFEDCFLTTAACGVVGLPDDCFELRALRRFRDRYMMRTVEGRAEIAKYYARAPALAAHLAAEPGARALHRLYRTTILPCAVLATLGFDRVTHRLYRRMMRGLEA